VPVLPAPGKGVDAGQPPGMEKLEVEDTQSVCERRWNDALRPVEITLHRDGSVIGESPFPEGGQVRTGERDHAKRQVDAADRDRAGRRLSLRTTVGGAEERPLVRAARPIAAEPGQAAVSGVILCDAARRFRVPEAAGLA